MNTQTFCTQNNIRISAEYAYRNPHMDDPKWQAHHYKVTLTGRFDGKRRQFTTYFSMGMAHTNEPTAEKVLDCLASDAAGVENARSFEDWASEYGYDEDSRKAEKIFRHCERSARNLQRFLGSHYETLIWKVEKL